MSASVLERAVVVMKRHRQTAAGGNLKVSVAAWDGLLKMLNEAKMEQAAIIGAATAAAEKEKLKAMSVRIGKCPKHPTGSHPSENCKVCLSLHKFLLTRKQVTK